MNKESCVTLVKIVITYLLIEVRHAKARLFTHPLKAATAAMHSIFGQEEDYRKDDESEQPKHQEHE